MRCSMIFQRSTKSRNMKNEIADFLSGKELATNSRAAYGYDLDQFVNQIKWPPTQGQLKIYEASLKDFEPTVQKRKVSAVNQFLLYLYKKGKLEQYLHIDTPKQVAAPAEVGELMDLTVFWQSSEETNGRFIALLIIEMGLLPTEILNLRVEQVNIDYRVIRLEKAGRQRILHIPDRLLPEFDPFLEGDYLLGAGMKPYSRQWGFRRLEAFLLDIGQRELTAQKLREQHILKRRAAGHELHDIARDLGLKTGLTLEKYR